MEYKSVKPVTFISSLERAQAISSTVRAATTPVKDIFVSTQTFYLSSDSKSGYAVNFREELTCVFSLIKGRGKELVKSAIKDHARHLDCFDGFLPTFYKKHGFVETDRVANWTEGQPDVVFMSKGVTDNEG